MSGYIGVCCLVIGVMFFNVIAIGVLPVIGVRF
jgi:hypothetical protein